MEWELEGITISCGIGVDFEMGNGNSRVSDIIENRCHSKFILLMKTLRLCHNQNDF